MGIFDRFKKSAAGAKAGDLASEHGDKVKEGLDKAGDFIDEKTGGKHSDRISENVDKAKDTVDDLGNNDGGRDDAGSGESGHEPKA